MKTVTGAPITSTIQVTSWKKKFLHESKSKHSCPVKRQDMSCMCPVVGLKEILDILNLSASFSFPKAEDSYSRTGCYLHWSTIWISCPCTPPLTKFYPHLSHMKHMNRLWEIIMTIHLGDNHLKNNITNI